MTDKRKREIVVIEQHSRKNLTVKESLILYRIKKIYYERNKFYSSR